MRYLLFLFLTLLGPSASASPDPGGNFTFCFDFSGFGILTTDRDFTIFLYDLEDSGVFIYFEFGDFTDFISNFIHEFLAEFSRNFGLLMDRNHTLWLLSFRCQPTYVHHVGGVRQFYQLRSSGRFTCSRTTLLICCLCCLVWLIWTPFSGGLKFTFVHRRLFPLAFGYDGRVM